MGNAMTCDIKETLKRAAGKFQEGFEELRNATGLDGYGYISPDIRSCIDGVLHDEGLVGQMLEAASCLCVSVIVTVEFGEPEKVVPSPFVCRMTSSKRTTYRKGFNPSSTDCAVVYRLIAEVVCDTISRHNWGVCDVDGKTVGLVERELQKTVPSETFRRKTLKYETFSIDPPELYGRDNGLVPSVPSAVNVAIRVD